jgi:hypothetical protein
MVSTPFVDKRANRVYTDWLHLGVCQTMPLPVDLAWFVNPQTLATTGFEGRQFGVVFWYDMSACATMSYQKINKKIWWKLGMVRDLLTFVYKSRTHSK